MDINRGAFMDTSDDDEDEADKKRVIFGKMVDWG
jgi:hypothetical protein